MHSSCVFSFVPSPVSHTNIYPYVHISNEHLVVSVVPLLFLWYYCSIYSFMLLLVLLILQFLHIDINFKPSWWKNENFIVIFNIVCFFDDYINVISFHFIWCGWFSYSRHERNRNVVLVYVSFTAQPASATYSCMVEGGWWWLESACRMLCIKTRQNHKTKNIISIICVIIVAVAVKPSLCFISEQDLNWMNWETPNADEIYLSINAELIPQMLRMMMLMRMRLRLRMRMMRCGW